MAASILGTQDYLISKRLNAWRSELSASIQDEPFDE